MRKVAMCFSLLQFPRYRIHTLANSWWESFPNIGRSYGATSSLKLLGSGDYGLQARQYRRLSRQTVTSKPQGSNKDWQSGKPQIENFLLDDTASKINKHKSQVYEPERTQFFDIQQLIAEKKDLAKLVTFIVFDIETTGFCRTTDRIIEIALQDLRGGKNSTFQTLVNPECYVPNTHVHGISTHMVNRHDVPRMEDLIPILVQYVRSRQQPNGFVVLVAHNGRRFDVPFLSHEFSRCSYEIPPDWFFLDTLPIAREKMKSIGLKGNSGLSLQSLVEFYRITQDGPAHRALSDVNSLSKVFQRLTFDLKLPVSSILEKYHFTNSDLGSSKSKKSSG